MCRKVVNYFIFRRRGFVRILGENKSKYVSMSSKKMDKKSIHRKPKISFFKIDLKGLNLVDTKVDSLKGHRPFDLSQPSLKQ